jgi:hypothetical protein
MQRYFYATSDDFLQVFDRFEKKREVIYTPMGGVESASLTIFNSGKSIPTLSSPARARYDHSYLITPKEVQVAVRRIALRTGGVAYAVDQLINPISIEFSQGGFYAPDILLDGRVATCSDHPDAVRLYRAFASSIAKVFSRVRAYYVGPRALELLKQGCRLTIGANSPREYDLAYDLPSDAA